jgi:hypothetical protein
VLSPLGLKLIVYSLPLGDKFVKGVKICHRLLRDCRRIGVGVNIKNPVLLIFSSVIVDFKALP